MHQRHILTRGIPLHEAGKALIMLHGRGASAEDILGLSSHLEIKDFALLAPQATNHTWYPYSFLAPPAQNEPWLSSALKLLDDLVIDIKTNGVKSENIFFLGFSQGACLLLEFAARHAELYGGIAALTGGLIGDKIYPGNYAGDFQHTPFFIGSSDPDPHVPPERVMASVAILQKMNADVVSQIYKNMGHTINQEEIDHVNAILKKDSP